MIIYKLYEIRNTSHGTLNDILYNSQMSPHDVFLPHYPAFTGSDNLKVPFVFLMQGELF